MIGISDACASKKSFDVELLTRRLVVETELLAKPLQLAVLHQTLELPEIASATAASWRAGQTWCSVSKPNSDKIVNLTTIALERPHSGRILLPITKVVG